MYTYHKIIVADARSGMESDDNLDRGSDPGYRGLLIHEIAYVVFGQVGNNETYRAIDEGFTQFLTAWATEVIEGEYMTVSKSYVNDSF